MWAAEGGEQRVGSGQGREPGGQQRGREGAEEAGGHPLIAMERPRLLKAAVTQALLLSPACRFDLAPANFTTVARTSASVSCLALLRRLLTSIPGSESHSVYDGCRCGWVWFRWDPAAKR